ncbi:MAG: crotonase/enoyl-CoA hydratase family protein [Ilumatobacteraceae bacterium]
MSERVTITQSNGIADVRLNRPDKRNALDGAMFAALNEAGESLKTAPGLRAVVLSGDGPSFCAGLDFSSFQSMADGQGAGGDASAKAAGEKKERRGDPSVLPDGKIAHLGQSAAWVWQEIPVPVIAAVHGHALGGGIQIALGADIRIVHPATKLSVREVYWGLVPDMTGTLTLARLVRADILRELVFTARVFSGTEAFEYGIATKLSDTPYDDAMKLADEIAGLSPDAVRGAKRLVNGLLNQGAAEQFAAERSIIGSLIGSPNQIESVMSGLQKRPPKYEDVS